MFVLVVDKRGKNLILLWSQRTNIITFQKLYFIKLYRSLITLCRETMQYRYIKTYSLSRRGENKLIVSSILFPFSFLFFTGRKTEPLHNYFQTTSIVGRIITSNVIIISNLIKTRESFRSSWNHSAVSAHISPSKKEERRRGEGEGKKRRKKKKNITRGR